MSEKKQNPINELKKISDPNNPQNGMMKFVLFILVASLIFSLYSMFEQSQKQEWSVTYTQYQQFLKQNLIIKAKIYKKSINDYEFAGTLKEPVQMNIDGKAREVQRFTVKIAVVDNETERDWAERGITWNYLDGNDSFMNLIWGLVPWLLIGLAFYFYIRWMSRGGMGGGGKGLFSFGKSRAKLNTNSSITFADVAGVEEAKIELQEVVEFLKEPEKFQKLGGKIPRGVLLLGPPGTGKTLLARAVAGEASVPFFSISGADFVEMFVGVGASRVRDLFENAKRNSPCIVFIDEIDAVGRQRGAGVGGGHDEREQTLNALLVEMDGFEQNSGIIVIAATNRADVLDAALLRPGRFDRQVVVDRPDIRGREGIFKVHTDKITLGNDVDINVLAKGTPGLSGADIANIVNEAALLAARRNAENVMMYDFEMAKDKVLMGVERKSLVITDKEKENTAYHEMGHALIGHYLPNADPIHKVTIIPRGQAMGLTQSLPQEDMRSYTLAYLNTNITVLLGGRAAEKIIFNSRSTGASNDIQRATTLATKMVCEWGMSEKIGPITYLANDEEVFLGRDISRRKIHSEKMAETIDEEIKHILDSCAEQANQILTENIEMLHKTAKILIERETIDGEELKAIIAGKELPPISKQKLEALKSVKLDVIIGDDDDNSIIHTEIEID
ncbi:MAG: ATP-dependent zinc metalloprotease FtsH [Ignavibacteria bacterium]|jgi:cell division protease FtsH|nr:ATP-dependent zinc metalloprotease FtsH [Ignavibacteria bacterium]